MQTIAASVSAAIAARGASTPRTSAFLWESTPPRYAVMGSMSIRPTSPSFLARSPSRSMSAVRLKGLVVKVPVPVRLAYGVQDEDPLQIGPRSL